jgi:hypothetical protein
VSNGRFAFAALSAILLLAAVPACAQVTCGATSYSKICHAYEYPPGTVQTVVTESASAENNETLSASVTTVCPFVAQAITQFICPLSGSASFNTLPIAKATTWYLTTFFSNCYDTYFPPGATVTVTVGGELVQTVSASGCELIPPSANDPITVSAGAIANVSINVNADANTTVTASFVNANIVTEIVKATRPAPQGRFYVDDPKRT